VHTTCLMNCIIWNCSDATKVPTRTHCYKLMMQHRMDLLCYWRLDFWGEVSSELLRNILGICIITLSLRWVGQAASWPSGETQNFRLDVFHAGRQAFAAVVSEKNWGLWVFVGVYASTNRDKYERRELWRALPVCFVGDLNVLTELSEKKGKGGHGNDKALSLEDFVAAVNYSMRPITFRRNGNRLL